MIPCSCIAPIVTDEVGRYCPACGKGYETERVDPRSDPPRWHGRTVKTPGRDFSDGRINDGGVQREED